MTSKTISPEKITSTPVDKGAASTIPVSGDLLRPDPRLAQEMGFIGRFIGCGDNARLNIVFVIIIVLLLSLVCLLIARIAVADGETRLFLERTLALVFSAFTGSIGFVTGTKTS